MVAVLVVHKVHDSSLDQPQRVILLQVKFSLQHGQNFGRHVCPVVALKRRAVDGDVLRRDRKLRRRRWFLRRCDV